MRPHASAAVLASLLAACGTSDDPADPARPEVPEPDSTEEPVPRLDEPTLEPPSDEAPAFAHQFPSVTLAPGEETDALCQQWTPAHDETLYVNAVGMETIGGFHHMNFFFVPADYMEGEDGTFPCDDRGYNLQVAAVQGGVLFAQSTQADAEVQRFGRGAALEIPAGYKIVGNLHLLNTTTEEIETHLTFELFTIPESDVTMRMTAFLLEYGALDIAPGARSQFSVSCNFAEQHETLFGRPVDFAIHRLLPHYHELGELLRVERVGPDGSSEVLVETTSAIGEPVGKTFDPPIRLTSEDALELTCGYSNDRTETVGWGIDGEEMCIVFGYSDSDALFLGGANGDTHTALGPDADSVLQHTADCAVIGALPLLARE